MGKSNEKIVVYGGTGYYGRKVVEKLTQKGKAVRVVSRDIENARKILGASVELFQGDVTDHETIIASLENTEAIVICLSAMSNKLIKKMEQIEQDAVLEIMNEASKAGVSRLVYMSGYEMRAQLLNELKIPEFGAIKIEVESKISQSSFNWTILGDAPAFEIFFAFVMNGNMVVPGGGLQRIPSISPEDVGEITAQTVLRKDLGGKRLRLTGPEALSFPDVAERITRISGKQIKHRAIPLAVVNGVSLLLTLFAPFSRYLYKSLLMLNNFPKDLAEKVPEDHKKLRELFDYEPVTIEMEIKRRLAEKTI